MLRLDRRIRLRLVSACGLLSLLNFEGVSGEGVPSVPASAFLDSIGTLSAVSVRGETLRKTIECTKYLGVRWLRAGIEGNIPLEEYVQLHEQAGLRFSWGFGSGSADLRRLIETARPMAKHGALLAFEGPNEPNNWSITYHGDVGGKNNSWLPVAKLQRELYQAVKGDPVLQRFPVWSISEVGAETDDVGLQFLVIPDNARTQMPAGTRYADFANVHNYIYHPNSPAREDNKTWNAADPTPACKVDGLYGEYGRTWGHHYAGYSEAELLTLPRVTTETGTTIGGEIDEETHALNLLTMYLDQFKRGWSYTAVYLLRDRVDEDGNQKFGFYGPDYKPRRAAVYLHNLTAILNDTGSRPRKSGNLNYSIQDQPATVHDLLLQKSDGSFSLIIWNEQVKGWASVSVAFGSRLQEVALYDPTESPSPIKTLTDASTVQLRLSNHPMVIEATAKSRKP